MNQTDQWPDIAALRALAVQRLRRSLRDDATVQDIAQEVAMRIHRSRRPTNEHRVRAWVLSVTDNLLRDTLRGFAPRVFGGGEMPDMPIPEKHDADPWIHLPGIAVEASTAAAHLHSAMSMLREFDRAALLDPQASKFARHRARQRLAAKLAEALTRSAARSFKIARDSVFRVSA